MMPDVSRVHITRLPRANEAALLMSNRAWPILSSMAVFSFQTSSSKDWGFCVLGSKIGLLSHDGSVPLPGAVGPR